MCIHEANARIEIGTCACTSILMDYIRNGPPPHLQPWVKALVLHVLKWYYDENRIFPIEAILKYGPLSPPKIQTIQTV